MLSLVSSKRTSRTTVIRVRRGAARRERDQLVSEEPLQVRVSAGGESGTVAVTMRTPGHDFELAAGFLFSEGVVSSCLEIARIGYCHRVPLEERHNVVTADLKVSPLPPLEGLERQGVVSSACGVCGRRSIRDLEGRGVAPVCSDAEVGEGVLLELPHSLRRAQGLFRRTGGLHAAGLFSLEGELIAVREDVGRHNALDKLLGWALLQGRMPLEDHLLVLSGRVSYELMMKAAVGRVPVVAAVSAPSSLAVALAHRFGITLAGFVRDDGFNLYAHPGRVRLRGLDSSPLSEVEA